MDWNWFFSSISQSSAAIVGLLGAFILTKTLNSQSTYIEKANRMKTLIAECEKHKKTAEKLHFRWYNRQINEEAKNKFENLITEDSSLIHKPAEEIYHKLDFSLYQKKSISLRLIKVIQDKHIKKEEEKRRKAEEERRAREERAHHNDEGFLSIFRTRVNPLGLSAPNIIAQPDVTTASILSTPRLNYALIQTEKEKIDKSLIDTQHHTEIVKIFLDSVVGNPEYSKQINVIVLLVTLLFFAGVIYPVSFMPLPSPLEKVSISLAAVPKTLFSLQGGLLTIISAIFCAIPYVFYRLNKSFIYNKSQVDTLTHYRELSAYSEYFSYYEENLKEEQQRKEEEMKFKDGSSNHDMGVDENGDDDS